MSPPHYIVELYPDGKFDLIENPIENAPSLARSQRIQRIILSDTTAVRNRERCLQLARNLPEFERTTQRELHRLLPRRGVFTFSQAWQAMNHFHKCQLPPAMLHMTLERTASGANAEYVPGAGLARKLSVRSMVCSANRTLKADWCMHIEVMWRCLNIQHAARNKSTLETVNTILARRGVFSIGFGPRVYKKNICKFAEMEGVFAHDPTGIEDVAIWGSSDKTYEYTGSVNADFQDRIYFNADSVQFLYRHIARLLQRIVMSSPLWLAKRFGRSLSERELILFLLTADAVQYPTSFCGKPGARINLRAMRKEKELTTDTSGNWVLASMENRMKCVAKRLADQIEGMIEK